MRVEVGQTGPRRADGHIKGQAGAGDSSAADIYQEDKLWAVNGELSEQ